METVLEVKNLTKSFYDNTNREVVAINQVSFSLHQGESLGIVGESGSGKSSIGKAIMNIYEIEEGEIFLFGKNIMLEKRKNKSRNFYRKIYGKTQMIFQMPQSSFNPKWTIGKSMEEGLINLGYSKKEIREEIEEVLDSCNLKIEILKKYPHEISGGECQRVAIGRAILLKPDIIICDEVTSALDVTVQKQILELLKDIQYKRNISYLFITHNIALLEFFCDRVLILHEGNMIEEGAVGDVLSNPKSEYTKQLINAVV